MSVPPRQPVAAMEDPLTMSASASSANISNSTSASNSSSTKAKTTAKTTAASLLRSLGSNSSSGSGSGSSPANTLMSAPPRNKRLEALSSFGKEIGSFFHQQASSAAASTSSLSGSGSGSGSRTSPLAIEPDISRDDLMHLCMKLNKRLKTLESNFTELKESESEAAAQRDELLGFVMTEVLRKDVLSEGLQMSLPLLQREWAEREEERNVALQIMQQQHRDYVQAKEQEIRLLMSTSSPSTTTTTTTSSSPSSASTPPSNTDMQQQQQQRQEQQQQQLQQLFGEMEESRAAQAKEKETESLRKELQGHVKALEEEKDMVISLHNQLAATKTQHEKQKMEEEEEQQQQQQQQHQLPRPLSPSPLLPQNEKEVQATLALLHSLQHDLDLKTQRIATLEEQLGASSILLQQKEMTLEEHRLSLSHHHQQQHKLTSSLQTSQCALQGGLHDKETLQQQQQKAEEWQAQLDEVRSALSEKNGLVKRLKEELERAEQLHASKATQVVQLEGGVQEMVQEMGVLREAVKEGEEMVAALKRDLDISKHKTADAEMAQARAEAEPQQIKSELEKELWAQKEASLLQHRQQREAHDAELTTLRRDNNKKNFPRPKPHPRKGSPTPAAHPPAHHPPSRPLHRLPRRPRNNGTCHQAVPPRHPTTIRSRIL
eukprot:evm.model.NODE_42083_length_13037_cov_30.485924.4